MNRILLAEDEEVLRMLIVDTLEDEDYMIDEAADGGEAMELFQNNHYDLVILDYMMPVYTGLELLKKYEMPKQRSIQKFSCFQRKVRSMNKNGFWKQVPIILWLSHLAH